jgi:hypothetical protein
MPETAGRPKLEHDLPSIYSQTWVQDGVPGVQEDPGGYTPVDAAAQRAPAGPDSPEDRLGPEED